MESILCILAILAPVLVQGFNCNKGWTTDWNTGTCYKVVQKNMNWWGARWECSGMARNSRLAVIESSHDNEFVKGLLKKTNGFIGYWMGATDDFREGSWDWIDGSPMDFEDWHINEPNNQGNEDCALFGRGWWWGTANDYKWNDAPCSRKFGAVCQIPYVCNFVDGYC